MCSSRLCTHRSSPLGPLVSPLCPRSNLALRRVIWKKQEEGKWSKPRKWPLWYGSKLNFKLAPYIFDMVFCVWSVPHHVLEVKLWAVKMFHLLCSSDFHRHVSGQTPGLIIGQSVFHWVNPHTDTDTRKKIILVLVSGEFQNHRKRKKKTCISRLCPSVFIFFCLRTNKDTVQCLKIQLEDWMWNSMSLCFMLLKRGRQRWIGSLTYQG